MSHIIINFGSKRKKKLKTHNITGSAFQILCHPPINGIVNQKKEKYGLYTNSFPITHVENWLLKNHSNSTKVTLMTGRGLVKTRMDAKKKKGKPYNNCSIFQHLSRKKKSYLFVFSDQGILASESKIWVFIFSPFSMASMNVSLLHSPSPSFRAKSIRSQPRRLRGQSKHDHILFLWLSIFCYCDFYALSFFGLLWYRRKYTLVIEWKRIRVVEEWSEKVWGDFWTQETISALCSCHFK